METAQLSELMKECGITGAGGAGFPAHMKQEGEDHYPQLCGM